MYVIEKLDVLIGLPGSGKSEWAQNEIQKKKNEIFICNPKSVFINIPQLRNSPGLIPRNDKDLTYLCFNFFSCYSHVILEDSCNIYNAETFLEFINPYVDNGIEIQSIVFHYWISNRKISEYNLEYIASPEEKKFMASGKEPTIHLSAVKMFFPDIPIKIEQHLTEQIPAYKHFCAEHNISLVNGKFLCSNSWCCGGSEDNLDGGEVSVTPDNPIQRFEEFDLMIDRLCPHISTKKYKEILDKCVFLDFYKNESSSSCLYYIRHACNMEVFYELYCKYESEGINNENFETKLRFSKGKFLGQIFVWGNTVLDVQEQIKALLDNE